MGCGKVLCYMTGCWCHMIMYCRILYMSYQNNLTKNNKYINPRDRKVNDDVNSNFFFLFLYIIIIFFHIYL